MSDLNQEGRRVFSIAWPTALGQFAMFIMGVVDTAFAGALGTFELASTAAATQWIAITGFSAAGILMGTEAIFAESWGRDRGKDGGSDLAAALVLNALFSLVLGVLWWLTPELLALAGQASEIVIAGGRFARIQISAAPAILSWVWLRAWLITRGFPRAPMIGMIFANLFNIIANYVFSQGVGGWAGWGLDGLAVATSLSRWLTSLVLLVACYWIGGEAKIPFAKVLRGVWPKESLRQLLRFGLPIGASFLVEMTAWGIAFAFSGMLGAESAAAHAIVLQLAGLGYMIPAGISSAVTVRISELRGMLKHNPESYRSVSSAALSAVMIAAAYACISGTVFIIIRDFIPRLFSKDPSVIALCASLLPIVAAFQIGDGLQAVSSGILRGLSRPAMPALMHFSAYYFLALPLAYFLAVPYGWGIKGIWLALAFGLCLIAAVATPVALLGSFKLSRRASLDSAET